MFKIVAFNIQRGEGEHFDFAQCTIGEGRKQKCQLKLEL
jgi:hypothetical protein